MKQFGTILFLSTGDVRGPWIMMLSVDLDNDGTSEGVMGVSTRFAVPIIPHSVRRITESAEEITDYTETALIPCFP